MTDELPFRGEGYWDRLDASQQSVVDAIEDAEEGWTVHAVILSGESDEAHFATVVRSRVGDHGLLLSERMVRIPREIDSPEDIGMLDNGVTRRVSGPLAKALVRGYARADNDRLAAEELEAGPLCLSAVGERVTDSPEELVTPLAPKPEDEIRDSRDSGRDCEVCGGTIDRGDALNLGSALGSDGPWIHERCQSQDGGGR